jgi:WD repeat-containing protein 76
MTNNYEKKRLENIEKNNEILKSLGLAEKPIAEIPVKKAVKRKREVVVPAEPSRRSLRAKGQNPEGYEEIVKEKQELEKKEFEKAKRIEGDVQFEDHHSFFRSINEVEDEKLAQITGKYSDYRVGIAIGSIKVTPEMIYSIAPFPSTTKLLAAAGDKKGTIGIWDIDHSITDCENEQNVYSMKPHAGPVMKLQYIEKNSLVSCSQDGTMRQFDCQALTSLELFVHPSKHAIGHFDYHETDLWYATHHGEVGLIDRRKKNSISYQISERKLNTMVFNPTNKDYFCTAGLDGIVRIFDVRNIKSLEPLKTFEHSKSCNSAFWSPDGKHIISTSFDDTLGLWKNVLGNEERLSIPHNNNTGRWIQKFKAVWNPRSDTIMVGNMKRAVDLFDIHGRRIVQLKDEELLTAIPAVNVFHPQFDLIVSGNASGKMTIWK